MKHVLMAGLAALMAAACQTQTEETADATPDARQGKEVSQVCFTQQIRSWKPLGREQAVIIEKGMNEHYKLDLIGTCRPDDAFMNIGLVSRFGGGSCLSRGDDLVTDARYNDGPCSIRRIYEWNDKAEVVAAN
jgi:hypothetical protein